MREQFKNMYELSKIYPDNLPFFKTKYNEFRKKIQKVYYSVKKPAKLLYYFKVEKYVDSKNETRKINSENINWSTFAKIFKKFLAKRIWEYFETNNYLSTVSLVFEKGKVQPKQYLTW